MRIILTNRNIRVIVEVNYIPISSIFERTLVVLLAIFIDDIKGRPDVSYVDTDTARELTKYLDSLMAEDLDMVTMRSLKAVKQFIEYNMISRSKLNNITEGQN